MIGVATDQGVRLSASPPKPHRKSQQKVLSMKIYEWRSRVFECDLTPTAKLIALALSEFYRPNKPCFPSLATLQEFTSFGSLNTIRNGLKELEEAKIIRIEQIKRNRRGGKPCNCYVFLDQLSLGDISNERSDDSSHERSDDSSLGDNEVTEITEVTEVVLPPVVPQGGHDSKNNKSIPESEDEAVAYFVSRKSDEEQALKFLDYWNKRRWHGVKDWKGRARTWMKNNGGKNVQSKPKSNTRKSETGNSGGYAEYIRAELEREDDPLF